MHQIAINIIHYVVLHKDGILALFGGGAGLWALTQTLIVKLHINGPKLAFILSHVTALLTAGATYWISGASPNVGVTYGWLWVAVQFWHKLVLNPGYNKYFVPFLDWLAQQKIAKTPAQTAPALVPQSPAVDPNAFAVG